MRGYDVVMTTGTDEHGVNVERSAQKAGVPESEFVAKMAAEWRALWDELGVQGDEFIRTTDLKHAHTVQWLFKLCRENGFVYPGHYTGQYCIYDNAYVDVKPGENCPDCGRPTETVTEPNYFFKLSAFQKPLLDWYARHPEFIRPEARRNEVLSFVEGGLRDLSITRTTIRWGIPVPGEEPHVFYVWFDALTAYLSAVGGPNYEKSGYWPADLHLVGKEIIRFHAVYWPAFLMAAGLPLPKQIWAHGWLLMDSAKMSKSLGNVIRPRPIVHVLGMDALRYYLLRETVFGQDGNFSYDALVQRYNSDLANGLGNLASRTAAMIEKSSGGKIPKPAALQPQDSALATQAQIAIGEVMELYDNLAFSRALEQIWSLIAATDKYLTTEHPWSLGESDAEQQRRATILWTTAEVLRIVTAMTHPVLPESTTKVWSLLGQPGQLGSTALEDLSWDSLRRVRHWAGRKRFPAHRKTGSNREDGSHGKRSAERPVAGHHASAREHARCRQHRCCCRSAASRAGENRHRRLHQSRDARRANQDSRTHRRRGQIVKVDRGYWHGDSPDLRRHRAIL
jgi:methionyl-tRNA synthetase